MGNNEKSYSLQLLILAQLSRRKPQVKSEEILAQRYFLAIN